MTVREHPRYVSPWLARTIGKATAFGLLANIVQLATRLVTVPLVVHHLGLDGYGMWNILMTTVTYMRFGTVGIKAAFQKYVAEATATGDFNRANRLLSTGCAIVVVVSASCLLPAGLFSGRIAIWLGTPPEYFAAVAAAISLFALTVATTNVAGVFESILTGGHRIDLVRKFATVLTILEAVGIASLLHAGFGLVSMAVIMGVSEILYCVLCFTAARRVVPCARVTPALVSSDVVGELIRFGGSYQLISVFESIYLSMVPIAVLRHFGASAAGVYALVTRVVGAAGMVQEAFLPSVLSGGSMVYASGSVLGMQRFINQTFKVTLGACLLPLSFVAAFGPALVLLWTGQDDGFFAIAFVLVCASAVLNTFSLLCLALYRTSGRGLLDNVRQVVRLALAALVVSAAGMLGFKGVLQGIVVSEFVGLAFMLFALTRTFPAFDIRPLLADTTRFSAAVAIIVTAGLAASLVPIPLVIGSSNVAIRLVLVVVACGLAAYPAVRVTGAITTADTAALLDAVGWRRSATGGAA